MGVLKNQTLKDTGRLRAFIHIISNTPVFIFWHTIKIRKKFQQNFTKLPEDFKIHF